MQKKVILSVVYAFCFLTFTSLLHSQAAPAHTQQTAESTDKPVLDKRIIRNIQIIRHNSNQFITLDAIKNSITYKEGDIFSSAKSNKTIKKLFNLGFFENIKIRASLVGTDQIDLFIILDELPHVTDIQISGNKNISDAKIESELNLSKLRAVNERILQGIVKKLRKLYQEKDFHFVDIKSDLEIKDDNKATIIIKIDENSKSLVKRVQFKGNKHIRSKDLAKSIFTREDWLFSFATKAGSYQPDKLEKDKRYLENHYKTLGYMNAKVTDAQVKIDPKTNHYTIVFTINEGDLYRIKDVHVQAIEQVSEYEFLKHIPIKPGMPFSIKDVMDSIDILKKIVSEFGYLFADIQPSIVPDETDKTVDLSFEIETGAKVFLNRLTIKGNKKTRDHIIRRKVIAIEGARLTQQQLDISKQRVEAMSFWEKENGVQWKINRINDQLADLDLILKEAKTGKIIGQIGWGGNQMNMQSASEGFNWGVNIYDINLFGKGLQFNCAFNWSKYEWSGIVDITEPYLLDRPLEVGYNFHIDKAYRSQELWNIKNLTERYIGTAFHAGYILSRWSMDTVIRGLIGIEGVQLNQRPQLNECAQGLPGSVAYGKVIREEFKNGLVYSLGLEVGQDMRNHIVHPSGGFQWSLISRVGIPSETFGYFKIDADYSWYTSLIDEMSLVLCFHTHLGYIKALKNKTIPFKELFNIGGPATVRGFEWGEISPSINLDPYRKEDDICGRMAEPIGGRKAFVVNLELTFPIKRDHSMSGALFYDGGSGWCPPKLDLTQEERRKYLQNACFDYRQSIGVGFRMTQPQPIRIDWGFKLDRRPGESAHEVHLTTYREF